MTIQTGNGHKASTLHKEIQTIKDAGGEGEIFPRENVLIGYSISNGQPWKASIQVAYRLCRLYLEI